MTRTRPRGLRWRIHAACAQTGAADEWFPAPNAKINPLVLRVCNGCPVWRDCLLYAIARPDIWHGVWAGLTPRDVAALRARLMSGELGADLPAQARRITGHRSGATIYHAAEPRLLPESKRLRRKHRRIMARLRAVGLVHDGQGQTSRGAAA